MVWNKGGLCQGVGQHRLKKPFLHIAELRF